MDHIVIIGNGISGVTAARHIRKNSDKKITIVSAETKYFFSRTALMYIYMGHMKFEHTQPYENWFWDKNNIDLKEGFVGNIDTDKKVLEFSNGENLTYNKLIIATGSKPNKFGWPGQDLDGVMGMYHKQDLENLEKYAPNKETCKRAVIVGGGLIGIELAEMLRSRKIPVTFLVREASFWNGVLPAQESEMINEHIKEHHIDLRLSTNLREIKSDENGKVKSVIIEETGEDGRPISNNVGVVSITKALQTAQDYGLDLVEVAPGANPPVCRVMDFGKFQYEQQKKEKKAKKNQQKVEVKNIQLRPKTDDHHIGIMLKRARNWLEEGKKVRVQMRFRGREITHSHIGREKLEKFEQELSELGVVEQKPNMEGRDMIMILAPNTK